MSWSVRTCVECGEYRYVEDGVCRDCQVDESEDVDGYDFSKLDTDSIREEYLVDEDQIHIHDEASTFKNTKTIDEGFWIHLLRMKRANPQMSFSIDAEVYRRLKSESIDADEIVEELENRENAGDEDV